MNLITDIINLRIIIKLNIKLSLSQHVMSTGKHQCVEKGFRKSFFNTFTALMLICMRAEATCTLFSALFGSSQCNQ